MSPMIGGTTTTTVTTIMVASDGSETMVVVEFNFNGATTMVVPWHKFKLLFGYVKVNC